MAIQAYLLAKGFELLERFIAENWDEVVAAGKDGLQKLITKLKEKLGLQEVAVMAAGEEDPLVQSFGAMLDSDLPSSPPLGCSDDCDCDSPAEETTQGD